MKQRPVLLKKPTAKAPLYRHVFYGRFSFMVVFVLLCSILLQPIDRARASEGDAPVAPAPIDTSIVSSVPAPPAPLEPVTPPSNSVSTPPVVTTSASDSSTPNTTVATLSASVDITSAIETATNTPTAPDAIVSASSITATEASQNAEATSTAAESSSTPVEVSSSASSTSTPDILPSVLTTPLHASSSPETPVATTTSATPATSTGEVVEAKAIMLSDSQIQFNKSECVAVADGSYYCKTKTPEPVSDVKDGLYSKPDVDGDLEIYFAHNGTVKQITHNQVDDASPYYDSLSNTIVWHRLVNDRYQIISYDITSGAESQLTTDTVNNMEPTRAGKYTAWQHWNKDNWDIMLNDGATTKLLSTVLEHDIAPKIRGNLVMWNRLSRDNSQSIELYDLTTGESTSIADDEGGELSNPRMVLVYDAQFKNGDVVTKGYDVVTGKISPLSAVPVQIPDKIPAPDKTGETRALIQMKTNSREDTEPSTTTPTIDPPQPDTATTSASSSIATTLTLDLHTVTPTSTPVATTTSALTLNLTSSSTLELTDADIVVPVFTATTTSVLPPQ